MSIKRPPYAILSDHVRRLMGLFSCERSPYLRQTVRGANERKDAKNPDKVWAFWRYIYFDTSFWRHHPESNRGIKVLQTSALPLGYGAGLERETGLDFGHRQAALAFHAARVAPGTKSRPLKTQRRCAFALWPAASIPLIQIQSFADASHSQSFGAGDGARTRHLCLGKAALYRMSYSRVGASEWSRTTDTGIFSPLLYQLSYRGEFGDPEGARTPDLQRDRLAF